MKSYSKQSLINLYQELQRRISKPAKLDWQQSSHLNEKSLDKEQASWLFEQGSLTQRLISVSDGDFSVKVLAQNWQKPRIDESDVLSLERYEVALVREVFLLVKGQPWVFARSVIPKYTLHDEYKDLESLQDKPLGDILFSDPNLLRSEIELTQISFSDYSDASNNAASEKSTIWGRRSVFSSEASNANESDSEKDKSISVSEFFIKELAAVVG